MAVYRKPFDLEEEQQACLKRHNEIREVFQAEPLILAEDLCQIAMEHAKKIAEIDKLEHSTGNTLGENIYVEPRNFKFSTAGCGIRGTMCWYNEIRMYDYDQPEAGSNRRAGHFTQVIWKGSKEIGIGFAHDLTGSRVYLVANYRPAGNCRGLFWRNVLKGIPKKDQEKKTDDKHIDDKKAVKKDDDKKAVKKDDDKKAVKKDNDKKAVKKDDDKKAVKKDDGKNAVKKDDDKKAAKKDDDKKAAKKDDDKKAVKKDDDKKAAKKDDDKKAAKKDDDKKAAKKDDDKKAVKKDDDKKAAKKDDGKNAMKKTVGSKQEVKRSKK